MISIKIFGVNLAGKTSLTIYTKNIVLTFFGSCRSSTASKLIKDNRKLQTTTS
jgi:hypothetical protein